MNITDLNDLTSPGYYIISEQMSTNISHLPTAGIGAFDLKVEKFKGKRKSWVIQIVIINQKPRYIRAKFSPIPDIAPYIWNGWSQAEVDTIVYDGGDAGPIPWYDGGNVQTVYEIIYDGGNAIG